MLLAFFAVVLFGYNPPRYSCHSCTQQQLPHLDTAKAATAVHSESCHIWTQRQLDTVTAVKAGHSDSCHSWTQGQLPQLDTATAATAGHSDSCHSWTRWQLPKLDTVTAATAGHSDSYHDWTQRQLLPFLHFTPILFEEDPIQKKKFGSSPRNHRPYIHHLLMLHTMALGLYLGPWAWC